jgi:hypothetical protein
LRRELKAMTKAEKETIIRWDCEDPVPVMYTSDPAQASVLSYKY